MASALDIGANLITLSSTQPIQSKVSPKTQSNIKKQAAITEDYNSTQKAHYNKEVSKITSNSNKTSRQTRKGLDTSSKNKHHLQNRGYSDEDSNNIISSAWGETSELYNDIGNPFQHGIDFGSILTDFSIVLIALAAIIFIL